MLITALEDEKFYISCDVEISSIVSEISKDILDLSILSIYVLRKPTFVETIYCNELVYSTGFVQLRKLNSV